MAIEQLAQSDGPTLDDQIAAAERELQRLKNEKEKEAVRKKVAELDEQIAALEEQKKGLTAEIDEGGETDSPELIGSGSEITKADVVNLDGTAYQPPTFAKVDDASFESGPELERTDDANGVEGAETTGELTGSVPEVLRNSAVREAEEIGAAPLIERLHGEEKKLPQDVRDAGLAAALALDGKDRIEVLTPLFSSTGEGASEPRPVEVSSAPDHR